MFCEKIYVFHNTSGFAQITRKIAQKRVELIALLAQKKYLREN